MKRRGAWSSHAGVLVAYAALALLFAWPLPVQLGTHLTGSPGHDTGVYVWNQWVFQHELLQHRALPYFTDTIFGPDRPANLSLHNYTTFQNVLALPLIQLVGVVAAFNIVYLLMTVLTAYAAYLLARHVTGRTAESWLAGALFAWSPLLVTRGMGHFSLVAAAPLAIFLLLLLKADGHERMRDAVGLGIVVGWAATTDVYYAVYCLLIGAVFLVARVVSIERSPNAGRGRAARWGLDVLLLCVSGLVVALAIGGGWEFTVLGRPARVRSLYTPVLILTVLLLLRAAWHYRASFVHLTQVDLWRAARLTAAVGVVAAAVLSPVLYAAALRIAQGRFETPPIYWRSSASGVDLLAMLLPNPNHPFAPDAWEQWLTGLSMGYLENVVSVPAVALVLIAMAWRTGWRPSCWWTGLTVVFGLLALGPFINIGGINTYVPGPWALLRYVPVVGLARTPARFSVVMMLGVAILFAAALAWIGTRYPQRRRLIVSLAGALLLFELLPSPRTLHSAGIPAIYSHIAAAPENVAVLELPFGVRDGTASVGDFSARTQFFQTAHGKPIMGGYLSRVSWQRLDELRRNPVLNALALLSEGRRLTPEQEQRLLEAGERFVTRRRIGFVVVERWRASEELRGLAIKALRLEHVATDGEFELYATPAMTRR